MKYQAILFDMDGTLVPMDNEVFTKGYFQELAKKLSPLGLAPDKLIEVVWAGTKAMVMNDGSQPNDAVFWKLFSETTGQDAELYREASTQFYSGEFENARVYTQPNPLALPAVRAARETGAVVVCATNPLFPLVGQKTRLGWVSLSEGDFDYISSYETENYCKPNPAYYQEICRKIGVAPENCLMIGNDVREDMIAASSIGMDCILVTDTAIMNAEWNGRKSTFADLLTFLKTL